MYEDIEDGLQKAWKTEGKKIKIYIYIFILISQGDAAWQNVRSTANL